MRIDFREAFFNFAQDFAVGYATAAVLLTMREPMKEAIVSIAEEKLGIIAGEKTRFVGMNLGVLVTVVFIGVFASQSPVIPIAASFGAVYGPSFQSVPLALFINGMVAGIFGIFARSAVQEAGPD